MQKGNLFIMISSLAINSEVLKHSKSESNLALPMILPIGAKKACDQKSNQIAIAIVASIVNVVANVVVVLAAVPLHHPLVLSPVTKSRRKVEDWQEDNRIRSETLRDGLVSIKVENSKSCKPIVYSGGEMISFYSLWHFLPMFEF